MFSTRPPHRYSPALLSELGTAELFVLSALRLWFLSHCDREREYPDWRRAFETAGISGLGVWGFDRLCRVVGTTTLRSLDIHWLQCGRLSLAESLREHSLLIPVHGEEARSNEPVLRVNAPVASARLH
jgi:hypothetical protein